MQTQTATHTTLLARLGESGDAQAWGDFLDRYGELLRGFCRHRGLSLADSDDVLQDVLLSLTKSMPGFEYDPTKGKFRSYLKTVVMHAISRRSRQNPRVSALETRDEVRADANDEDRWEDQWEEQWRRYHLRQAMRVIESEFSSTDRQAFDRYALRGEQASAVAESLGLSLDSVYQAKSRIAKRLTALIQQQVHEEG